MSSSDDADEAARRRRRFLDSIPPPLALDAAELAAWREPRFGNAKPERLTNPLWTWLVDTRLSAETASTVLGMRSDERRPAAWCFDRMGRTSTALPDGRVVHIAGEHEDFYDPDFFIYNDVTIVHPDGRIEILGYPRDVFAPTDFHSATLLDDHIVVIGCLGEMSKREVGATPVYRLAIGTWAIERIGTHGDAPGWISSHEAALSDDGRCIVVRSGEVFRGEDRTLHENIDTWSLDLATWRWRRETTLDWQRWTMLPTGRHYSHLREIRQQVFAMRHLPDDLARGREQLREALGHEPDLTLVDRLYALDDDTVLLPQDVDAFDVYKVRIDNVVVRFTEDSRGVAVVVEGRLSDDRLAALQRRILEKLSRLENTPWDIEPA